MASCFSGGGSHITSGGNATIRSGDFAGARKRNGAGPILGKYPGGFAPNEIAASAANPIDPIMFML
jgi:hypothetical protein